MITEACHVNCCASNTVQFCFNNTIIFSNNHCNISNFSDIYEQLCWFLYFEMITGERQVNCCGFTVIDQCFTNLINK